MTRHAKPAGREIRHGATVVGVLLPDRLRKVISGSQHLLKKPRLSIAIDCGALDEAAAAGVDLVEVVDTETDRKYFSTIANLRAAGFPVLRGHGRQIGLPLSLWSSHEHAAVEQLSLFGGDHAPD